MFTLFLLSRQKTLNDELFLLPSRDQGTGKEIHTYDFWTQLIWWASQSSLGLDQNHERQHKQSITPQGWQILCCLLTITLNALVLEALKTYGKQNSSTSGQRNTLNTISTFEERESSNFYCVGLSEKWGNSRGRTRLTYTTLQLLILELRTQEEPWQ